MTSMVAIRLYTRPTITKASLGLDDCLSVLSWGSFSHLFGTTYCKLQLGHRTAYVGCAPTLGSKSTEVLHCWAIHLPNPFMHGQDHVSGAFLAVIEANVGIICASSSTLPAFIDRHCSESIKTSIVQMWSNTTSRGHTSGDGSKASSRQNAQELKLNKWSQRGFAQLHDGDIGTTIGVKSAADAGANQQV
ncbi:hypothetical protein P171DRAFT_286439 [Karstenula rhodostoma CBS 690.94]|uniref:Uncharacterized protein n=1 Tax=Karstenula rhodostoma CBS 690.94 TaxID=1392251 RepID=A0A9P4PL72_9PLEO|nr:hypothetical protein P171DRAFT_286439 [Karstenula rhodostoma CBS 690.94]